MNELMVVEQRQIFNLAPDQMVLEAKGIAKVLSKIIEDNKLFTNIQGHRHVKIEGWITLGNFLGVLPQELSTKRLTDGTYEAVVELVSLKTSQVVGRGSAICTPQEKPQENARRSMAITRATGKAYRLGFSWIMALTDFNTTPAEEMSEDMYVSKQPKPQQKTAPKPTTTETKPPFDPSNTNHSLWLAKELEKRGIDPSFWSNIGEDLKGKNSSELDTVLKKYEGEK